MERTDRPFFSRPKVKWLLLPLLLVVFAAATLAGLSHLWTPTAEQQVAQLTNLLALEPGMTVAEIGAGQGQMTVSMATYLGPQGHVFSTEIEPGKRKDIEERVSGSGLSNVTVVEAAADSTNLPPGCCDAIFMAKVYHHFKNPAEIGASLFEAIRPGGRLAVIDFSPVTWAPFPPRPGGVKEDRRGHGMPQDVLIEELTAAGFHLGEVTDPWGGWPMKHYCVVFRRPAAPEQAKN